MNRQLYTDVMSLYATLPIRPKNLVCGPLFSKFRNERAMWRIQAAAYKAAAAEAARVIIERAVKGDYNEDGEALLRYILIYLDPQGTRPQFEGDTGLPPHEDWGEKVLDWLAYRAKELELVQFFEGLVRDAKEKSGAA